MSCDQQSAQLQLPVIDFSCLRENINSVHESAYHELRKACEEWGCFVVVNHGIDSEIIHCMETAARATFRLPEERKENNKPHGYVSAVPANPFMQSIAIPRAPHPHAIQSFVHQLWPQGNPHMCKITEAYARAVYELIHDVIKAILTSLGMGKYYHEFENNWENLRLNQCGSGGAIARHTDVSCIGVINQDKTDGLQVLSKGGEWVNVKPVTNSFVVIIGDALTAWSNGRIHNVTHRVIVGEHETAPRVNMPYFSYFSEDKVISAAPEFVDDHHPRLYRDFVYGEYREYRSARRAINWQRAENSGTEANEDFLQTFAGNSADQKTVSD